MRNLRTTSVICGFTLTELLISLLVGLLVLEVVSRVFVSGLSTQNTASLQTEMNRKAQVGIDSIVSKLRGSSGITEASAARIWFLDQEGNNCRFWVADGILHRYCGASQGSYTGGEHVATDVKQLQFSYLDRAGQPATSAGLAYSVVVLLETERSRHNARLQSAVRLRNK